MKRFDNCGCQLVFSFCVALIIVVAFVFLASPILSPTDSQNVLEKAGEQSEAGARAAGEYIKMNKELPESIDALYDHNTLSTSTDTSGLKLIRTSKRSVSIEYHDPELKPKQRRRVARKTASKVEIFPATETLYTIRSK